MWWTSLFFYSFTFKENRKIKMSYTYKWAGIFVNLQISRAKRKRKMKSQMLAYNRCRRSYFTITGAIASKSIKVCGNQNLRLNLK